MLKNDHREVEDLFAAYEKARSADRKQSLAEQICLELTVHAKIEEEIFYPACEGKVDDDLLSESYVEHDGAKVLIAQLLQGTVQDEYFDAKVSVLKEQIDHHVEEEEKRLEGLFAQAKKAGVDLDAIGKELQNRKDELREKFASEGIPAPEFTTLQPTA